jgi:hypothetical protein
MATFSQVQLSGSTQGKNIKVAATSTPGTAIHATGISGTILDTPELYATNTSTSPVELTLECGGTASPDDLKIVTIPPKSGDYLILKGVPYSGTGAAALTIRAFAGTGNVINISGGVTRMTP